MGAKQNPPSPILLVDDEPSVLRSYRLTLEFAGLNNIITLQDSREVIPILAEKDVETLVLDLTMPHISGEEILEIVSRDYPDIPVLILTGINEVDTAVNCIKKGALNYLVKPVESARFVSSVKQAIELQELRRENSALRHYLFSGDLKHPETFSRIATNNPAMKSIFQYVEMVAPTSRPVLITGESGVGKELISKCVHDLSKRTGKFVPINIAGLDDNLFADTLFGHEKGAYTGAESKRPGLIEKATGGTLFFDEIGDLEMNSQIRLLRLIQEGEYYPLGSDTPKHSDVRIVVATNKELQAEQNKGTFRKDLYYRLSTHQINIPPLRERLEDLPVLIDLFLNEAADSMGKRKPALPPELFTLLRNYHFPGNIRELQGMLFDSLARHNGGVLSTKSFRDLIHQRKECVSPSSIPDSKSFEITDGGINLLEKTSIPTFKEAENFLIKEAMKRADGNQKIASEMLGITRQTLNKRLKIINS